MKLVACEFGQCLQFISMDEVRPQSGVYLPDLLEAIVQRYRFAQRPTDLAAILSAGAKFQIGKIDLAGQTIAISELGIFNDGVLISTRTTDDSDIVIDDFMVWVTQTFRMRAIQNKLPRKHASHVVVDFEVPLDGLFKDFEKVRQLVATAFEPQHGRGIEFHATKIGIGYEPPAGMLPVQTSFSIEARVNSPLDTRRYFCAAPLKTAEHLDLLSAIEKTFS